MVHKEQCAVTLIHVNVTHCSWNADCNRVQYERSDPLTWAWKKYAPLITYAMQTVFVCVCVCVCVREPGVMCALRVMVPYFRIQVHVEIVIYLKSALFSAAEAESAGDLWQQLEHLCASGNRFPAHLFVSCIIQNRCQHYDNHRDALTYMNWWVLRKCLHGSYVCMITYSFKMIHSS